MRKLRTLPWYFFRKYFYHRFKHLPGVHRLLFWTVRLAETGLKKVDEQPQSIFERGDWDNLIILDACRHDIYEEVTGKDVPCRITLGSTSGQYAKNTFDEGDFSDIVYVNGNGWMTDQSLKENTGRTDIFHSKFDTILKDPDKFGIPPSSIVKDAKTAEKLFPGKRKIIHFMQPHEPFLDTDIYDKISESPDEFGNIIDYNLHGIASKEEIRRDYKKNLEIVLEHVDELKEVLDGRTVVTADHGELLGENGLYRHHDGSRVEVLRKVPWDVISD